MDDFWGTWGGGLGGGSRGRRGARGFSYGQGAPTAPPSTPRPLGETGGRGGGATFPRPSPPGTGGQKPGRIGQHQGEKRGGAPPVHEPGGGGPQGGPRPDEKGVGDFGGPLLGRPLLFQFPARGGGPPLGNQAPPPEKGPQKKPAHSLAGTSPGEKLFVRVGAGFFFSFSGENFRGPPPDFPRVSLSGRGAARFRPGRAGGTSETLNGGGNHHPRWGFFRTKREAGRFSPFRRGATANFFRSPGRGGRRGGGAGGSTVFFGGPGDGEKKKPSHAFAGPFFFGAPHPQAQNKRPGAPAEGRGEYRGTGVGGPATGGGGGGFFPKQKKKLLTGPKVFLALFPQPGGGGGGGTVFRRAGGPRGAGNRGGDSGPNSWTGGGTWRGGQKPQRGGTAITGGGPAGFGPRGGERGGGGGGKQRGPTFFQFFFPRARDPGGPKKLSAGGQEFPGGGVPGGHVRRRQWGLGGKKK